MSLTDSIKVGGAVLVIGIAMAFYHRGNIIAKLEQQLHTQSEQLKNQQQAYTILEKNLEIERQATLNQKAINDEIQRQQTHTRQAVRSFINTQPCTNVVIDKRALERLYKP